MHVLMHTLQSIYIQYGISNTISIGAIRFKKSPGFDCCNVLNAGANSRHAWPFSGLNSPTVLYKRPNRIGKAPLSGRLWWSWWSLIMNSHFHDDLYFC